MDITYNENLKRFLNENGGDEKEFLMHEIKRLKNEISKVEEENKGWRNYKDDLKSMFNALRIAEKIKGLEDLVFDYETRLSRFPKEANKKEVKSLLVSGKKLNISERYKIANEVTGLYNSINKKNITATDKHVLLAHIMGCSQQVARELFNGTQIKRTPIREEVVNPYLDKLK